MPDDAPASHPAHAPAVQGASAFQMMDEFARAEAALARAEAAAAALQERHAKLRSAAHDTLAGLDRLLGNQHG